MADIKKVSNKLIGNIVIDEHAITDIVYQAVINAMKDLLKVDTTIATNNIDSLHNSNNVDELKKQKEKREELNSNFMLLKEEHDTLKTKYDNLKIRYDDLEISYINLKELSMNTKTLVEKLKKRNDELEKEMDSLKQIRVDLESKYNILFEKNNKCEEDNRELNETINKVNRLMKAVEKERDSIEKELEESFGDGQSIFKAVKLLPSAYIEYLGAEIRFNELESFIISSTTNPRTLLRIWNSAYMAIVDNNDQKSFKILWTYFEYCCYLYNLGRSEVIIEISNTQVGDFFDCREVNSDLTSVQRGYIKDVYIQGFINKYTGEVLAKSYVHVE